MWEYDRSTNQWAWLSGTSSHQYNFFYDAAVPGTLGVPAVGNVPAGRTEAMTWKDKNGDFCLFGGDTGAIGGYLNDLWKYSPATSQWEWVSGTTSVPSCPQGNCGLSGVYGTLRTPAAANNPGARSGAVTWTDSQGNLWLFDGYGYDSTSTLGYLNDLWRFSPSTNQWAWMGGSSSYTPNWTRYPGQSGVYGVMGEPDAANVPGGRSGSTSWVDHTGSLWLFGGRGFDSIGSWGDLNDLWKFNPSTNQWTWVGGSSTILSAPSSANAVSPACTASCRYRPLATCRAYASEPWVGLTSRETFGCFGGHGLDSVSTYGYLNDLWQFSPSTNQWTWMAGADKLFCPSAFCDQPATYGTLLTPGLGNAPSGRISPSAWTDPDGNLWLFGGQGIYAAFYVGSAQDVWQYQPNTNGSPRHRYPDLLTCIRQLYQSADAHDQRLDSGRRDLLHNQWQHTVVAVHGPYSSNDLSDGSGDRVGQWIRQQQHCQSSYSVTVAPEMEVPRWQGIMFGPAKIPILCLNIPCSCGGKTCHPLVGNRCC